MLKEAYFAGIITKSDVYAIGSKVSVERDEFIKL